MGLSAVVLGSGYVSLAFVELIDLWPPDGVKSVRVAYDGFDSRDF